MPRTYTKFLSGQTLVPRNKGLTRKQLIGIFQRCHGQGRKAGAEELSQSEGHQESHGCQRQCGFPNAVRGRRVRARQDAGIGQGLAVYISFGASSRSMITDWPHLRSSVKDASEFAELYLQISLSMKSRPNEKLKTMFRGKDRKDCVVALMLGKALSLLYQMLVVLLSSRATFKLGDG